MRLTHHHRSTRSFIIIIIVVLATVYTAFTLIKLQKQQAGISQVKNNPKIAQTRINTDNWKSYIDAAYPLNILVPTDWKIDTEADYSGFYNINFTTKNNGVIKVFISNESYAGVSNKTGLTYKTNQGVEVTKHDDLLYTTKVGEYYYTFDATLAINQEKELAEIIRTAKFD